MIYLDNAATSWPKPEIVYKKVDQCLRQYGANPGRGGHRMALQAGRMILETRELLANLFNVRDSARIIFTQNVTESLNLAIKGILEPGDHVLITSMEHNSVLRPVYALKERGVDHTILPCTKEGLVQLDKIPTQIRKNTRLICVNHASNVTGTIQPLEQIGAIAAEKKIPLLVDCAQTAGILPIDVEKDQISLLAFTGHKGLMGPPGTGGLYIHPQLQLRPLIEGGTGSNSEQLAQPRVLPDRFESGTPNTSGIAGLGAGVRFVFETGLDKIRQHEHELTQQLLQGLAQIPGISLYGTQDAQKQTAVVSLNLEGWEAGALSYALDQEYAVASRGGLHCAPLAHANMGTLEQGTLRLSLGYFNTSTEIGQVLQALQMLQKKTPEE